MKAMILAAGGATRLYPLTYALPKPMVPVLNVPVIEHVIQLLARHGFNDIMVNVHYLHRLITDQLGDGSRLGVKLQYSREPELLGTAGGVRKVSDFFDDTFLVIGADDLTDLDLGKMLEFHRSKKALATVAVAPLEDPTEFGVLEIDEESRVTWFLEKPTPDRGEAGRWSNTGVYIFEPGVFEWIPKRKSYDFGKQVFPELVRNRTAFFGYPIGNAFWRDVGSHLHYREAHWTLLDGRTGIRIPGREIRPHVWAEDEVDVSPQAYIRPPVLLGRGCRVEAGAQLQGPVVLGPGAVVQEGAAVRSSVLWDHCQVGRNAQVDDCLVGSGCLLTGGQRYSKMVLASGARVSAGGHESSD